MRITDVQYRDEFYSITSKDIKRIDYTTRDLGTGHMAMLVQKCVTVYFINGTTKTIPLEISVVGETKDETDL